jgi:hypothetical protein
MTIYVGNLSYDVTEADLQAAFAAFRAVASVSLIKDRYSGQSKGFGFVEMPAASEAQAAITGLHGKALLGWGANRGDGDAGRPHARVRSVSEELCHASAATRRLTSAGSPTTLP